MKIRLTEQVVINPTLSENNPQLFALFNKHYSINNDEPIKSTTDEKVTETLLTHSIFRFEKPIRRSKTGKIKPPSSHFAVLDNQPLGEGSFGAVYSVIGTWKFDNNQWTFKTKAGDPEKKRVVKTNLAASKKLLTPAELAENFRKEYGIGRWVPHLSYKYQPVTHGEQTFLLMRKQPGDSLEFFHKKLLKNRNYLTVMQRLMITVSILEQLDPQIHNVRNPTNPNYYLVHCDIKPHNIMISSKWEANYIDYGLAQYNNRVDYSVGTAIFVDPYVYSHSSQEPQRMLSALRDVASAARVIAELWGDTSRDGISCENQNVALHTCNRNNVLTNLCENIEGFQENEKQIIIDTIQSMTRFHTKDRLSKQSALKRFKQLLDRRLALEETQLCENATNTSLDKLSPQAIIAVLKSRHASMLIARYLSSPDQFQKIIPSLGNSLLDLDEKVLLELKKCGLNYSNYTLTVNKICDEQYTATQVERLIKLKAPLDANLLQDWLSLDLDTNETKLLHWVQVCREIYKNTPTADEILAKQEHQRKSDSFQSIFCDRFLSNPKASTDDLSNIRLIKKHLEITAKHKRIQTNIKTELIYYYHETPFAKALSSSPLIHPQTEYVFLKPIEHLTTVLTKLKVLTDLIDKCNQLKTLPNNRMPSRKKVIESLQLDISNRMMLNKIDLETALLDTGKLQLTLDHVKGLDLLHADVSRITDNTVLKRLEEELDAEYADSQIGLKVLEEKLFNLKRGINLIEATRSKMAISPIFPPQSPMSTQLASLSSLASFRNTNTFMQQVGHQYNICALAVDVYHTMNLKLADTTAQNRECRSLYRKIKEKHDLAFVSTTPTETVRLLNQLNHFISAEEHIRKKLLYKPRVNHFLDSLFLTKLESDGLPTIGILSKYSRTLITDSLIDQIETFDKLERRGTNNEVQLSFREAIWTYLSHDFTNKSAHLRQIDSTLGDLIKKMRLTITEKSACINAEGLDSEDNFGHEAKPDQIESFMSSCTIC